jgi:hypothetical protein
VEDAGRRGAFSVLNWTGLRLYEIELYLWHFIAGATFIRHMHRDVKHPE